MKKRSLFILVSLLVFTVGCTSTQVVEPIQRTVEPELLVQVEEPQPSGLARIENPKRFIKYWPLDPFNGRIGLLNSTGYTLTLFDLFSLSMYEGQNEQNNLLSENLEDGRQVFINLDEHPILVSALASSPAPQFVYNAIDSDGDLYSGQWDPNKDEWNIVLTLDHMEDFWVPEEVTPFGSSIVIANNTGYPIERLHLEHKHPMQADGSELNLLGDQLLLPGKVARIATEDLQHLSEYLEFDVYATLTLTAFDTDGDRYILSWHPTTDLWYIELDFEHYRYFDESSVPLLIENATGQTIWYLYAVSEESFALQQFDYYFLGSDLLNADQSLEIDLSDDQRLIAALKDTSSKTVHLVAKTQDETLYHRVYDPSLDSSFVRFTSDDRDVLTVDQGGVITLENETGDDLWFLYLVTDEMLRSNDFGPDLLGDDIWEEGTLFSFTPSLMAQQQQDLEITLIALDFNDRAYQKQLRLEQEAPLLTFTAGDLKQQ